MQLSDKRIKEFKDIFEKESGKKMSWEEAAEGAYGLARFAELMFDSWVEDQRRKKKLEESPRGFHLEGIGYTCFICGSSISNEETWYDKYGIKCLICQRAIDKKIIPATAAKNKDGWYSKYDLESRFNIDRHALNRFVKQGVLKPRIVPSSTDRPHTYLFLIKDNKDILPPKKLTKSRMVKEVKDGKEWFHSEPWYKFEDPQVVLKDYKIMNYLRVVTKREES